VKTIKTQTIDTQSRKWQTTINNPIEKGFTHDYIKEVLGSFNSMLYWCMADEIGECGTHHTHIYTAFSSAVRFSSMKRKFNGAHFEMAHGTSQQNRDYIYKEGKWEKDKKKETHLIETREEYGQIPVERQGARNDISDMVDMVKNGACDMEIIDQHPQMALQLDRIDRLRQRIRDDKMKNIYREILTTYIYGQTGTGKTRGVLEKYGYENVYRITDYTHPFDGYKGQDVVLFEEFRSNIRIGDMLTYLEGYPQELPCRYSNKVACYTKVYFTSNVSLIEQYENIQREHKETWNAFLRRIHTVHEYKAGAIIEKTVAEELWWEKE